MQQTVNSLNILRSVIPYMVAYATFEEEEKKIKKD